MSDIAPRRNGGRSELISELFRILRIMASDKDVSEPYFRIAFRIAQYANADTGWAIVSDRTLVDVLPRTTEKKLRLFRRYMEQEIEGSKWLRTVEGERGRPTSYHFIPDRIPEIERRLAEAAEKREAEFALQEIERRTALHAAALEGQIYPVNSDGEIGLPGQSDPPSMGGKSVPSTGPNLPPLLPQTSTSQTGYRKQDKTRDAHAHLPASAHAPVRANPPPPPLDDDDGDPIAASGEFVRADVLAWKLPLLESGQFACFDCGAETQLAARYKSERYCPFCTDCIETGEFPDVKSIPSPKSYAEASEGE